MKLLSSIRTFLSYMFRRNRVEREMEDEFRSHLALRAAELEQQGISSAEALRQARIEFGGYQKYKEECREALGTRLLQELWQDVRYGVRQLRRNPGFTVVAVLTLALGIGANTAIFSVVNTVLLRPLPYHAPDDLVWITEYWPHLNNTLVPVPDFLNWRDQNQAFQDIAAYAGFGELDLSGNGEPERINGIGVTWNFFSMLGVRPQLGRDFLPEEDRPDGAKVVILAHSLWARRFNSNPRLVGETITLDGKAYTVIGIMPASFQFPGDWSPELFAPADLPLKADWYARNLAIVGVIARLRPEISVLRAKSDIITINSRSSKAISPPFARMRGGLQVRVVSLHQHLVGNVRSLLLILLAAVGCVLLVACANVANLQLTRAVAREREIAVRASLGAGRWRLARQLMTESLALAILGGMIGLVLGFGGVEFLRNWGPHNIHALKALGFDQWVLTFVVGITGLTGVIFGLAPIATASKLRLSETLKESGPGVVSGRSTNGLRSFLVASEVALSMTLLIAAGLLVRSFVRLSSIDPGFDPRHVLTERIMLPLGKYSKPTEQRAFFENVLERIAGLPGVESVAAASSPPLTTVMSRTSVELEGKQLPTGANPSTPECVVSPSYFHTMEIPLITGKYFTPQDSDISPRAAIVNEAFARRFFGNKLPVGRRIRLGGSEGKWYSIVGVVRNTGHLPFGDAPSPEVFTSYLQDPSPYMTLALRTYSDPSSLAAAVRAKVWEVDRNQPVYDVATMEQRLSQSVAPQRFNTLAMCIFAVMGILLAVIGVYGVMAYSVAQRTHEIGIRMALGARPGEVFRLVLERGLNLITIGMVIGIAGALALTRFLSSLLYAVTPTDPLTFIAASLILIAVALLACYIPARRAAKVDPMVALRYE